MSTYPMTYDVEYVEQRSRLAVLFRIILIIPHGIMGIFLAIAAFFTIVAAWFAVVITGKYPQGLFDFNAGVNRWYSRYYAFAFLETDPFPPFGLDDDPSYPARVQFVRLPEYSRLLAFFRLPLALVPLFVTSMLSYVLYVVVFVAWFVQVILGKQPKGLHDTLDFVLAYQAKTYAYLALLVEDFPPFANQNVQLAAKGGGALGAGAAPQTGGFAPPVNTQKQL